MTNRNESCEARIGAHAEGRLDDFRLLMKVADEDPVTPAELVEFSERFGRDLADADDEAAEAARDAIYEYPLAVSTERVWRIDLSTGGPADWLEVNVRDGEATAIRYHFADWYDHAEKHLEGEDFEAADRFARALTADYYADGEE